MEDEYGVPVVALSCIDIDEDDIKNILSMIAYEFPIRELRFTLPGWVSVLESDNPLKKELDEAMSACAASKSAMTPSRRGRMVEMRCGVFPI